MKQRKPTYEELEKEVKSLRDGFYSAVFFMVVFMVLFLALTIHIDKIEKENLALKEQLNSQEGNWILKVSCIDYLGADNIYYEVSYSNYTEYIEQKEINEKYLDENCEVLP